MYKKKFFKIFCSVIFFCLLLIACSKQNTNTANIDEDIFNMENNNIRQQVDYKFHFGPKNIENPVKINEESLEYDMKFENLGGPAEFGIIIVADGIPQKVKLEDDLAIMHKVSLDTKESKEYKFIINKQDLNINDGEEHIIHPIVILEPDYIPQNITPFTHEGSLNASLGIPFYYTSDIKKDIKIGHVDSIKIDDQFRKEYNLDREVKVSCEILWSIDDPNVPFISHEDLKQGFDINLIGNVLGEMRVFLFVDNKPVKINGYDFYDVKIQKGMVSKIHVDFTEDFISNLKDNTPMFLLATPKNLDSIDTWTCKTNTKIIKRVADE
ncbi:hypothetical protein [Defluviitalea phaphyphila]|uniref:hypothetical protein n=1 Tax=Defluviitalea phaphyphila TaxID=1473580 RepID=UPI0007308FE6|nr:hypothetical protein [Defluviitalea phaphyphila]